MGEKNAEILARLADSRLGIQSHFDQRSTEVDYAQPQHKASNVDNGNGLITHAVPTVADYLVHIPPTGIRFGT